MIDPQLASLRLNDIARSQEGRRRLILATDPDREGQDRLSLHVLECAKERLALKDHNIERVVCTTPSQAEPVSEAMKHPRQSMCALVDAYMARSALDYLSDFTLSPVLWRQCRAATLRRPSAIEQSRLCGWYGDQRARDREIRLPRYWSWSLPLTTPPLGAFEAAPRSRRRQEIFNAARHRTPRRSRDITQSESRPPASRFPSSIHGQAKPARRIPAPFTTSTLCSAGSSRSRFCAGHTMRSAQTASMRHEIAARPPFLFLYANDGVQIDNLVLRMRAG